MKNQSSHAGHVWERDVFFIDSTFLRNHHKPAYLDLDVAIQKVKHMQNQMAWNPKRPHTDWGKKIFQEVFQYLPDNSLEMYCALGTTLDYYHGIDGFFSWRGRIATFDLTIRKKKVDIKADAFITPQKWQIACRKLAEKLLS